jgi:hypothetical protein
MRREVTNLRQQAPTVTTAETAADRMASAARQSGAVVEVAGEPERR